MESLDRNRGLLVTRLTEIQELVRQLEVHLDQSHPVELCKPLVSELQSSIGKSIRIAKDRKRKAAYLLSAAESPGSSGTSPRSEVSDQAFKHQDCIDTSKKRKTLPKWRSQVRVGSQGGAEGPLDDGYSWRKYGQKDILGTKHPRGYYRCTHRNTQGCPATKQVQRSDEDHTVFDIIYNGNHTCLLSRQQIPESATRKQESQLQNKNQDLLQSFHAGLTVRTEGFESLDTEPHDWGSTSFSFPSTPNNNTFSSSMLDDCFLGAFSNSFVSPATSGSNFFAGKLGAQKLESDHTEVISASTSATNSPLLDMDFVLDFDPSFRLDASSFFS
ncbi:probable WRKY transcription factor 53 [Typha angustifolia]|uniref:probable WRKY transcription factor 53 n=1 Tax=Typha angustifolia TaxID=59011 RepID=UPI003C2DC543